MGGLYGLLTGTTWEVSNKLDPVESDKDLRGRKGEASFEEVWSAVKEPSI